MIKIGVIGYGYWGPNLVRNFAELSGATVTAVSDLDPAKLQVVQRRYPAVKTTTDYRELLSDPSIDAIAVSTPVSTHFELGMAALLGRGPDRSATEGLRWKPQRHSACRADQIC